MQRVQPKVLSLIFPPRVMKKVETLCLKVVGNGDTGCGKKRETLSISHQLTFSRLVLSKKVQNIIA